MLWHKLQQITETQSEVEKQNYKEYNYGPEQKHLIKLL